MTDPNERPSEAPDAGSPSINEKETVRPVSIPHPVDVQPLGVFSATPPPVDVDSEPTPAYLVDDDLIDDDEPTYNGPARDSQAPSPSRPAPLGVKSRFSTAPPKQSLAGRISSPNLGVAPLGPAVPVATPSVTTDPAAVAASLSPKLGTSVLPGPARAASIVPPAPSLPPPSLPPPPARAPSLPPPKSRPGQSLPPGPTALPNLASSAPSLGSVPPRSPSLPPPKSAPRTSAPPPKSVPLPLVSATSTAPRPTTLSKVPAPSVHPARSALIAKRLTPAAVSTPPVTRSAPPPSLSTGPLSSQPPRDAAPITCASAERLAETRQTETWLARAASLESHAGTQKDPVKKARLLVLVSELYAMAGHLETARAIAERASKLGSHLAQRQARQLAQVADDTKAVAAHFALETNTAVTPETRRHSVLAHAGYERWTRKDPQAASRLLDQIPRVSPSDPLPRLLKLSTQLGQDLAAPMAAEGELPELTQAVHTLRRLRGESRPRSFAPHPDKGHAPTETVAPLDPVAVFLEVRRALERRDRVAAATALIELQAQPGFERSTLWLAAALLAPTAVSRKRSLELLTQLDEQRSTRAVRRTLLARGLELGDNSAVQAALHGDVVRDANEKAFSPADQLALGALSQTGDGAWLTQLAAAELDDDDRPLFAAASLRANRPDLVGRLGDVPQALVVASHGLSDASVPPSASVSPVDVSDAPEDPAGALLLGLLRSAGGDGAGPSPDDLTALPMLVDEAARGQLAFAAATLAETRGELKRAQELFSDATSDAVCGEAALGTLLRTREPNEASRLLQDFVAYQPDPDRKAELLVQAALLTSTPERQVQLLAEAHGVAPDHVLVEAAVLRLVDKLVTLTEGGDSLPPPSSPEAAAAPQAGLASKRLAILSHQSISGDNDYMRAMALLRHVFTKPSATTRPTLLGHAWDLWPKDTALLDLRERYGSLPLDVRAKARESLAASVSGPRSGAALKTEAALFYELAGMPSSAARVALPSEQRPALLDGCFGRNAPGTEYAARWRQKILERAQTAEHSVERSYYWLQVARLASDAGDWAAEREAVGRAIHLDPQNVEALLSAEALAFKDGEVERIAEVERYLAEALHSPDNLAHAQIASRFLHLSAGTSSGYTPLSACVDEGRTPGDVARKLAYQAPRMGDDELGYRMHGQLLAAATRAADKAALLVRSAELALKLGKAGTALTHLEDATGLLPSWVTALSLRGEVLSDEGYHAAAAEAFERLAQAAQSKALRAVAYRRAAEELRQEQPAADESSANAPPAGRLRVADPNRLRLNLERALEAAPEDESVFEMLVDTYVALRLDGELGELFIGRLEGATPEDHQRLTLRWSQACSQMGSSDRAFELVREVLQTQPESVGALEQLAILTKNAEERAHALLQLIRVSPTPAQQATAYQRLGDFYRDESGQPQRAIKCYQEVLRRRPDAAETFRALVDLQLSVGELTAAQATIDAFAAKASTENDQRMVTIAKAAMTSVDNPAAGEHELQALLAERPFDTMVIGELAQLYSRAKSPEQLQSLTERVRQQAERELPLGAHVSQYLSSLAALAKQRKDNSALVLVSAVSNLYHGAPSGLDARGSRAVSRALDSQLAPLPLSESLRGLLSRTSEALEEAFPLNIADLNPVPLKDPRLTGSFEMKAKAVGIAAPELFVVSAAPFLCLVTHHPSRVFLGLGWVERAPAGVQDFVVWRALKLLQGRVGAVAHLSPDAAALRLDALLSAYTDPGNSLVAESNAQNRLRPLLHPLLPKDPTLSALAATSVQELTSSELEVGDAIALWADRAAVLATGEPRVALLAVCLRHGETNLGSPSALLEAVGRQPSARRLMASLLSTAFIEAHRSIH